MGDMLVLVTTCPPPPHGLDLVQDLKSRKCVHNLGNLGEDATNPRVMHLHEVHRRTYATWDMTSLNWQSVTKKTPPPMIQSKMAAKTLPSRESPRTALKGS